MIQVLYSCNRCAVEDAPVDVPGRDPQVGHDDWMFEIGRRLGIDHVQRSPGCPAKTLSVVKIPKEVATQ